MKIFTFLLLVVLSTSACNSGNSQIKETVNNADSIAINYFKGDGSMDTVVAVKIIKDKNQIALLANFIGEQSLSGILKCGYDGSLHIFNQNQVIQDIDFRMIEDCMQFSFLQGGEFKTTKLSKEAKNILLSIKDSK